MLGPSRGSEKIVRVMMPNPRPLASTMDWDLRPRGGKVELAQGKYKDFNNHHLTEKLKEQEKIELSREKFRRILRAHGIASPQEAPGDQTPKPPRKMGQ